jgi:hypothetical protein
MRVVGVSSVAAAVVGGDVKRLVNSDNATAAAALGFVEGRRCIFVI